MNKHIPKTLARLVKDKGLYIAAVVYRFKGTRQTGYTIFTETGTMLADVEPYPSSFWRWRIVMYGGGGIHYVNSLRNLDWASDLKPIKHTGMKFSDYKLYVDERNI